MPDSRSVQEMLGSRVAPVAIAFLTEPPVGLPAWSGPAQPAGCSFWQKAWEGQVFYTVPADHFNCAVGAYTHAIDLPAERAGQLNETVALMVESGYLEMAEVPDISRLSQAPGVVAYAPAEAAAFPPDIV